jgi:hypothetical protein
MKKLFALSIIVSAVFLLVQCNDSKTESPATAKENFGGFESQVKWGEHLVTVGACHDCHSPKKMTPMGPDTDSSQLLAGHIAGSPEPVVNKKEMQDKGLVVTSDLTTWIGPWGTSYTANLTSDETGIGNWKEEQFMLAIREGKFKGLAGSRNLLPPMPWQMYRNFTDGELKAIFAYLKSTKPVKNVVPPPLPPADR